MVVFLHAYRWTPDQSAAYFELEALADDYGFVLALPRGTSNVWGHPYWNATRSCCDFFGDSPDDSEYVRRSIEAVQAELNIDPLRIHVAGLSNGGFMAHRMACDHSDLIASVASLSGATFFDPADCDASFPIHVLEIRGTADDLIEYTGGFFAGAPYPGAIATAEQWAGLLGCSLDFDDSLPPFDFDASVPGDETTIRRYEEGCFPFGSVELWSVDGGWHIPALGPDSMPAILEYFYANPRVPIPVPSATALPLSVPSPID